MKVIVNPHKLEIIKNPVNEKEINITKCEFEFAPEITNDYVKEAYFTLDGATYKQIIVNNECDIPSEVLVKKGQVELGVVAFLVESEEEIKRYNPSPAYFETWIGSLKDAENSEPITPSEMEQFEQALNDGLQEVANVDIDAYKTGDTATISVTNRQGITKSVEVVDGPDGKDAKINGVNTINIVAGDNITLEQEDDTLTINATGGGSGGGNVDDVKVNGTSVVTNKVANTDLTGKVDKEAGKGLSTNDFTNADKNKLDGLNNVAKTNENNNFSTAQTITGTLTVLGDISQTGTNYETHAEQLYTKKDLIKTRDGAVGGLGNNEVTGIEAIKYDGTNNGRLVFDNTGTAKVGDVGDEVPLLGRDESSNITDGQVLVWDSTNLIAKGSSDYAKTADVVTDVQINGTSIKSSGVADIPVASSNGLGVVSGNTYYGFNVDQRDGSKGNVSCGQFQYTNYQNASNATFISKGTLEGVITGKGLATTSQIPTNVSQLNNDSGYLTLGTLPIYNGGVQ